MNKLTKKITFLLSRAQVDVIARACTATALREVDIVRFGIFEMLKEVDATRYAYSNLGRLQYGESAGRIQAPLSFEMFERLRDVADAKGMKVADLARAATVDFARRNQPLTETKSDD